MDRITPHPVLSSEELADVVAVDAPGAAMYGLAEALTPAPVDAPHGYGATSRQTSYGVTRVHVLARDWSFNYFPERPGALWKDPAHWEPSALSVCGNGLDQKMNAPEDNAPHAATGSAWRFCAACLDPVEAQRDHCRVDLPAFRPGLAE